MGATPKCKSSDISKNCTIFHLQEVKYEPNTCKLSPNSQAEIEFSIAGLRPAGSTEEHCKLILIAGEKGSPLIEIQFSSDPANPDFQRHKGYIEVKDKIDPSRTNSPVSRKILVKYLGTRQTRITLHCKLRHGNSPDDCENCIEHQADISLELG